MEKTLEAVLIGVAVLCLIAIRILSGLKSGCYYARDRDQDRPPLLLRFMNNMHFVETPFWYVTFFGFGLILALLFYYINPKGFPALGAYLVTQGASAVAAPFYQGFINVGAGRPFVDPDENPRMELANPLTGRTVWIKRFWRGKARIWTAVAGLAAIVLGFVLAFTF